MLCARPARNHHPQVTDEETEVLHLGASSPGKRGPGVHLSLTLLGMLG